MASIIFRRELFRVLGAGAALIGIGATSTVVASAAEANDANSRSAAAASAQTVRGVVAEPTRIRPPNIALEGGALSIDSAAREAAISIENATGRSRPIHHGVNFETREVAAEIEPGAKFSYMTFNGQAPGPMIRVRRGDTVALALRNNRYNTTWHFIDLHAVHGPGGGRRPADSSPGTKQNHHL